MADYKELLNDTLNSLVGKAKELAGSESVGRVVDRIKEGAESSGVKTIYTQGADRAKTYGKSARLTVYQNKDNAELGRVYTEIGRLYFEQMRENPEGYFAPLFAQATALTESIHAREAEIAALKEDLDYAKAAQDIDVEIAEFEDIVNATEEDGRGQ